MTKESVMQYLDAVSKMTEWSLNKPFSIMVIQVYDLTSSAGETEVEQFYEYLQDLLKKRCPFHYRGLESKSRKSRNTWSKANLALEYRMKQGKG